MSAANTPMPVTPTTPDAIGLLALDPWLEPYADRVRARRDYYLATRARVLAAAPSLAHFARGHEYLGFNRGESGGRPGVWYREWAPAAHALSLIGDFNDWDRMATPLRPGDGGVWELFLPDDVYAERLTHGSRVKVHVHGRIGPRDRIPAYIRRAIPDPRTHDYAGQYWAPPAPYEWRHDVPQLAGGLRVYEAHVGMATEEHRVGTFDEFRRLVVPRAAAGGYNAIQLMAIQEHPYYGSFGYQVSNFFAVSSRFGTPEELKALIDDAHGAGLRVLLDLVHSHAVKNLNEGLNHFDGAEGQYFHPGGRGQHPAWDSLCFDYGRVEVLQFLLSNVRFWLEEYRFDGFRFDGVTSMIFHDHGLGRAITSYDDFFPPHTDEDAIAYLQLANDLAHDVRPGCITIAEDVSGLVGMARPTAECGVGFDYRLAMGVPDYWIKLLRERSDEQWCMDELFSMLCNRRAHEKHIGYCESHDQALVGDKTIAMWLMDADIYWHMAKGAAHVVIDRGMALHKMIRLLTFAAAGEGYLNFMGNEFGHPEWIDFPREGNAFSYHYARRQWSLRDNPLLRYHALAEFDAAMLKLDSRYGLLESPQAEKIQVHEDDKLLIIARGPLLFAFNFHPSRSQANRRVGAPQGGDYRMVLNTDDLWYGGRSEAPTGQIYPHQSTPWDHRLGSIQLYLPARTAIVLAPHPPSGTGAQTIDG